MGSRTLITTQPYETRRMRPVRSLATKLLYLMVLLPGFTSASENIFSLNNWFPIPDGTLLSPFFNPKDSMSGLPWDLTDAFSVAAGEIGEEASIVYNPVVMQLTYVLSGRLEAVVKSQEDPSALTYFLEANQAVLIGAGSFFQLRNAGEHPCLVLYIVSPAYVFETDGEGTVVYDDTLLIGHSWEELEGCGWHPEGLPSYQDSLRERNAAYGRMAERALKNS